MKRSKPATPPPDASGPAPVRAATERAAGADADVVVGARPQPTIERVWIAYLVCVAAVAVAVPATGAAGHEPGTFLWVHAAVLAAVLVSAALARRAGPDRARVLRAALAVIGLPTVFSSLCWLLPHVHPEPYEFTWLAVDRAVFGRDLATLAGGLPAWFVELLQLDYAAFYGLCVASALLAGWRSGKAAFDRAVLLLTGGFL
ncbi:MAG: hypothetical protein KAI24_19065, partial [Planctomycetes bacterium]|nr:hypothetical protein [Planctomycetota bacterium]